MTRENISAAVAFLSSPSIHGHPDESKRKFLAEKGLTNNEIIAAFAKSRVPVQNNNNNTDDSYTEIMDRCLEENDFPKNKSRPARPPVPFVVMAAVTTTTVGLVIYLYKLFRRYIWPHILKKWNYWYLGMEDEDTPEPANKTPTKINDILTAQVYELHDTISTIKSVLDQQQSQMQELALKDPEAVEDLRKEMESIKKLVLSKESFPPAPVSEIPSWQIRKNRPNSKQMPKEETDSHDLKSCDLVRGDVVSDSSDVITESEDVVVDLEAAENDTKLYSECLENVTSVEELE